MPEHLSEIDKLVRVAVICMEKKRSSKPMQSILNQLSSFNEFKIIQLDQHMILNQPIEEWPKSDAVISFYS
jgi:inositol-hexakisphosphate/diphosphoinositol-pentakisphosphate 1-kinase